jgi:hypothetical protein
MPEPRGKNATAKSVRRKAIVKALVNQQKPADIAATLGVCRKTVYNELDHPETKALIREWMQPHHRAIQRMIPRALATVNKGMKPSNEMRDRLNAVKTLGTVMQWAEGRTEDGDERKPLRFDGTLTELLVYARRITETP